VRFFAISDTPTENQGNAEAPPIKSVGTTFSPMTVPAKSDASYRGQSAPSATVVIQ